MDYNLYPKREHQLKWIAVYLEEAAKLRGKYTGMHEQNTLSVKISEMPTFLKELKSWSLQQVNLLGPPQKKNSQSIALPIQPKMYQRWKNVLPKCLKHGPNLLCFVNYC